MDVMARWACLLLLGGCALAQTPAAPGRLVEVGGYRVHLNCTGSGSPVVMIVGAGFSVDWALGQPEIARSTTVCTYDPSGTAWSDPGPKLNCREHVREVHDVLHAAKLEGPFVLAGLSIGGCVARLYAAQYPGEVAGLVIVDHAFAPDPDPAAGKSSLGSDQQLDSPPVLVFQTPINVTVEQSSEFASLPEESRKLHRWAASLNPRMPEW